MQNNNSKKFLCLDLGTSKTALYISGKGIVYNQFSKVAYDARNNQPIAIGNEADELDGKTSTEIVRVEYPIVEGIIKDMKITEDMLSLLSKKIEEPNLWKNSTVLVGSPSGVTELEKSSIKDIIKRMGAMHVILKESIQLAALGAGVDFFSAKGNLIIDIGAGSTDVSVVSAGNSVVSQSVKLSGESLNREIRLFIRNKYNIFVGDSGLNVVKQKLGCLKEYEPIKTMNVFGRDAISGLPKEVQLNSSEVCKIFKNQFLIVTDLLVALLEKTTENLTFDIVKNGMTIVGGMANIKGIKDFFEKIFRFKVNLIKDPELAVIKGGIKWESKLDDLIHDYKIEEKVAYKIK